MRARAVFLAVGSSGDVRPFAAAAQAAASTGREVTLAASGAFRSFAPEGVAFHDLHDEATFRAAMESVNVWDPMRGMSRLLREFVTPTFQATVDVLDGLGPGDICLFSPLALPVAAMARAKGFRAVRCHLAPSSLRSLRQPPKMIGLPVDRLPLAVRAAAFSVADLLLDRSIQPSLREALRGVGVKPPRMAMSDCKGVEEAAFFPEWFGGRKPDWPDVTVLGFPSFDGLDHYASSRDLPEKSFAAVIPGSADAFSAEFVDAAIRASASQGLGAVVVTPFSTNHPTESPTAVVLSTADYPELFGRASVVIHRGGIGTIAHASAIGVPQVVCPHAFDQLDNGLIAQDLGYATVCRVETLPRALDRSLTVAPRAAAVASSEQFGNALRSLLGSRAARDGDSGIDARGGPRRIED